MGNIKFVLNGAGVRELMRSTEMQTLISELGSGVQNRAGDGFAVETKVMPTRVVSTVRADTVKAYYSNLKNNTLLKALR